MPPSPAAMENSRTRTRVLKTLRDSVVQQTRLVCSIVSSSDMLAMVQGVTYSIFATAGEQLHIVPPCWRTLFTGLSAVQWTESEGCFGNMLNAAAAGATTLECHHLSSYATGSLDAILPSSPEMQPRCGHGTGTNKRISNMVAGWGGGLVGYVLHSPLEETKSPHYRKSSFQHRA